MDEGISEKAKVVSDIVFMKAAAMDQHNLAEVDYEVNVVFPDGTELSDSGTLRRDAFNYTQSQPSGHE